MEKCIDCDNDGIKRGFAGMSVCDICWLIRCGSVCGKCKLSKIICKC